MVDSLLLVIMIVGVLGIGSQWIAWKFRLPAIVVMSIAGLLAGPILGIINPQEDFGDLFRPFISIAVAIILFEGSLNLNFKEVKGLGKPVFRIVTWGAVLAWILGSLTAHYVAGLSWAVAFVIGGIFIVTGPTVILPLLRQSRLKPTPAKILKWEGIVVDPFGALLAVFAFETILFLSADSRDASALLLFLLASFFAIVLGYVFGKVIGWMFESGHMPEYLKSPAMFGAVIACFTIADEVKHETGLLAVTAMGMTLANIGISSIKDMRHFKENISILLISTVFILLTSSLTMDTLKDIFRPEIIGYVLLMLFVVRPLSIFISTIGSGLSLQEKTLVGWIAPRGIVALTVASYFASVLEDEGFEGASLVTSLTFALVFSTVCVHGFTIGWLAKKLNLSSEGKPGAIIVGSNRFSISLAKVMDELKIPVIIVDSSWDRLHQARRAGINHTHGEILSEQMEYTIDFTPYDYLISATEYDSYNALVCSTFVPEFGRKSVFRLPRQTNSGDHLEDIGHTIGGKELFKPAEGIEELKYKLKAGYVFRKTSITEQYKWEDYLQDKHEETVLLFVLKQSKQIEFFAEDTETTASAGDTIVSLMPPSKEFSKIREKIKGNKEASN
ncbi:sodium/proton antiporter, CPA1 family (TC 2.A.36) [Gracilibacillus ureilyticus]|uniref:Sodium/proton antiporter, CPA1 family (TC 2.A.36) n=1 Tax=Gracilibacillus ureilyticus TaxID=531814 RepID=A0A1H9SX08_9BACI|nr:sodium:proton antiporter [Gracilibacillus ureilyticus]SER89344.1 sodium/proton antiporter, CPA1 family (TC 2.A.36) [Gracilibacillus ureilyticus]